MLVAAGTGGCFGEGFVNRLDCSSSKLSTDVHN